jgi:hypothetical protein
MGFLDLFKRAKPDDLKKAKEGQDAIKNGTPEEKKKAIEEARKRMAERAKQSQSQ